MITQRGTGLSFARHLIKDAFCDVIVASPIGCPLSIGELIKVVTLGFLSERGGNFVNLVRPADKVAASPEPFDGLDLLTTRLFWHHSNER
jgi:hypothetical protein